MVHLWKVVEPFPRQRPGVTILAFSGAELTGAAWTRTFVTQIEYVAARARIITLDEAVRGLSREDHAVDNTVVITFDDGFGDDGCGDDGAAGFTDVVLPVLDRLHVPATVYLAPAFVEEQRPLPSGIAPMTWSAVGEAMASGLVTVGSSTYTRRPLDRADAAEASAEIRGSIDLIAARTGRVPAHFAYPDAVAGSVAARQIVQQLFHSAVAGRGRTNPLGGTDLHLLVRPPVTPRTTAGELDSLIRAVRTRRGSTGRWRSAAWPGTLHAPRR